MRRWPGLLLLPVLALGCLRSPLPADSGAPVPPARPGTRSHVPLEAVALGGPGLRGLDPARLPDRPLVPAPPPAVTEPLLAQDTPSLDVADKSRARHTDPVPPPPRPTEPPAKPAGKETGGERRPFLRPAVPEVDGSRSAAAATPAAPEPVAVAAAPGPQGDAGRTSTPVVAAPESRKVAVPPPPAPAQRSQPSQLQSQRQPQSGPTPEPEREILAAAERSPAPASSAAPVKVEEAPAKPAAPATPPPPRAETPARATTPPPSAPEPVLAQAPPAPILRTAGGGREPLQAVEEAEETRPARPTAPPDARFQVQIMSASDPEGADDMRLQAELVFPDEVVEVVWDPPYYKVRVGAAATQEAAVELKRRALRLGFQNAWVVPRRQP